MFLILFVGALYIIIGFFSLFISLLFMELGRPKDLIRSGLIILLGIFLIIYSNIFSLKISLILTLNAVLINFYFFENLSYRWNQLLDKEKFDIKSFSGFNKNFSIIYNIITVDLKNLLLKNNLKSIFKNNSIKKKWVRKNDIKKISDTKLELIKNIKTTDFAKEDIINGDKNNSKNTTLDK